MIDDWKEDIKSTIEHAHDVNKPQDALCGNIAHVWQVCCPINENSYFGNETFGG
jgi:hypothetical protein